MYQASMARGPHDVLVSGGLKMVARVPGGAQGTRLKSCVPSSTWYEESWGCTREVRSIFRESWACDIMRSQRMEGNCPSHVPRPAIM